MTREDLIARTRRLDELARGLAKELTLWRKGDDPLLYLERKAYLGAVQNILASAEDARVILTKVCERLKKEPQMNADERR